MSTQRFESIWRKNASFICSKERKERLLLFCSAIGALAQSTAPALKTNPQFSIRVTHLLGFANTKNNCNGTLSVKDDAVAI